MELSENAKIALDFFRKKAQTRKDEDANIIKHVLTMSDIDHKQFRELIQQMLSEANVVLHFHPFRFDQNGGLVAEGLLKTGLYSSQFKTLVSNGSLSPQPGGKRFLWEDKLFNQAYSQIQLETCDRPKYGALNLIPSTRGPAPRFGCCFFSLKTQLSSRCRFTFGDSSIIPEECGTIDEFDSIVAAILKESFQKEIVLNRKSLRPPELYRLFLSIYQNSSEAKKWDKNHRSLDQYIEAQIHSEVDLSRDIESLHIDQSLKATKSGKTLVQLAQKHQIPIIWISELFIRARDVPRDFRGPKMIELTEKIAINGRINPAVLEEAYRNAKEDREYWNDWESYDNFQQQLKLMWHILVRFGQSH